MHPTLTFLSLPACRTPCSPPHPASPSQTEWWEASLQVAAEAVVLNFVVAYYENYDNNEQRDHKVLRMVLQLAGDGGTAAAPRAGSWGAVGTWR